MLESLLQSQLLRIEVVILKIIILRELNKKLLAMIEGDEISDQLYSKIRSIGGQPARL